MPPRRHPPPLLLFFITLEPRVECYNHLRALNTSPARMRPHVELTPCYLRPFRAIKRLRWRTEDLGRCAACLEGTGAAAPRPVSGRRRVNTVSTEGRRMKLQSRGQVNAAPTQILGFLPQVEIARATLHKSRQLMTKCPL